MKTMLTLFAGGGLADLGAKAAGYRTVAAVEYDPAVCQVFLANHGVEPICAKVQEVDYRPYAGVTAVWASPSCIRASVANQDGGECEEDRSAAEAVCRCLREVRPEVFCLENVWAYRNFDSFALILAALTAGGYRYRFDHINAASLGVPQTRKRLLLRASLRGMPAPILPTHRQGGETGGLFGDEWGMPTWNGWHAAVEDLLPECPESRFAAWQLARLPAEMRTSLVESKNAGSQWGDGRWEQAEPAPTVTNYTRPSHLPLAYLVSNAKTEFSDGLRETEEPAFSVTGQHEGRLRAYLCDGTDGRLINAARRAGCVTACLHEKTAMPRAWLVDGQESSSESELVLRRGEEPCYTVSAGTGARRPARALLIGGGNTSEEQAAPGVGCSEAHEPCRCVAKNSLGWRAALPGRVVRLLPRCLYRFQGVDDSYLIPVKPKLACFVCGNGVPPAMALAALRSAEETR